MRFFLLTIFSWVPLINRYVFIYLWYLYSLLGYCVCFYFFWIHLMKKYTLIPLFALLVIWGEFFYLYKHPQLIISQHILGMQDREKKSLSQQPSWTWTLDDVGDEKMIWFLLSVEDAYCMQRQEINHYMDASNSDWYKSMVSKDGNDIPAQRALATSLLNDMKDNTMGSNLTLLTKNPLSSKFPQTIKLLDSAYGYLSNFLEQDKNLRTFEEFKTLTNTLVSSQQTLEIIGNNVKQEYSSLHPKGFTVPFVESEALDIDALCDLTIANTH